MIQGIRNKYEIPMMIFNLNMGEFFNNPLDWSVFILGPVDIAGSESAPPQGK